MKKLVIIITVLFTLLFISFASIMYTFVFTELPLKIVKKLSNNENFKVKEITGTFAKGINIEELEINKSGVDDMFLKMKSLVIKYDILNSSFTNQFTIDKFYIDNLYIKSSNNKSKNQDNSSKNKTKDYQVNKIGNGQLKLTDLKFTNITIDNDDETSKPFYIELFQLENLVIASNNISMENLLLKTSLFDIKGSSTPEKKLNLKGILKIDTLLKLKNELAFTGIIETGKLSIDLRSIDNNISIHGTNKILKLRAEHFEFFSSNNVLSPIKKFKAELDFTRKATWNNGSFTIGTTKFIAKKISISKKQLAVFESENKVDGSLVMITISPNGKNFLKIKIEANPQKNINDLISMLFFKRPYSSIDSDKKEQVDQFVILL